MEPGPSPVVRHDTSDARLLSPVPPQSPYLCRFTPELNEAAYQGIDGDGDRLTSHYRAEPANRNYTALLAANLGLTSPTSPQLLTPGRTAGILRFRPGEQSPADGPFGGILADPLPGTTCNFDRRKIYGQPFKVLDAPHLEDDFYLNLVDWSKQNVLAVGLAKAVYLWNAANNQVTKLCELNQPICSVGWRSKSGHLAVGGARGSLQVYDTTTQKKVHELTGHRGRIGVLAWGKELASGGKDRKILLHDVRAPAEPVASLLGHKSEVCGLRWSVDYRQLASGANDNTAMVWREGLTHPEFRITSHGAAVKALAWSPHQHGLLATGGGTADRHIRFHNTVSHTALQAVDTGSQVCNLAWSANVNEIVSSHGYSQNAIVVWRYPTLSKVATLTGHLSRVLYLSLSPDGRTIVTGAGDETLRFWGVFPGPKVKTKISELSDSLMTRTQIR